MNIQILISLYVSSFIILAVLNELAALTEGNPRPANTPMWYIFAPLGIIRILIYFILVALCYFLDWIFPDDNFDNYNFS